MTDSPFIQKLDRMLAKGPVSPTAFRRVVWSYYRTEGRAFPWRGTSNPYEILVSEVMLQQTQTDRVVGKYREFLTAFPTVRALSDAPLAEVLAVWKGLGYYRRALNLHRAAQAVCDQFGGRFPDDVAELQLLPGIGPYTAAAVAAFAFRAATPMIETNIRALYLYVFFPNQTGISDKQILSLVEESMDRRDPRGWFYALMDCGVELKRHRRGVHLRSKHHVKQSRFEGSLRQVRAAVLKLITERAPLKANALSRELPYDSERITQVLQHLTVDGFIAEGEKGYCIR